MKIKTPLHIQKEAVLSRHPATNFSQEEEPVPLSTLSGPKPLHSLTQQSYPVGKCMISSNWSQQSALSSIAFSEEERQDKKIRYRGTFTETRCMIKGRKRRWGFPRTPTVLTSHRLRAPTDIEVRGFFYRMEFCYARMIKKKSHVRYEARSLNLVRA
jgi:hypothetical protein